MKTISGKTCILIAAFLAFVHLIPATFFLSRGLVSWFARPLLAQNLPLKNPHESPAVILETIRGGRHKDYTSIVFQVSDKIRFGKPVIKGNEMRFVLGDVSSGLTPFRKYETFDSWVKLETAGEGLAVRIGLPEGFLDVRTFLLEIPHRMVVNIYDKRSDALPGPRMPVQQLQGLPISKSGPSIHSQSNSSILINEIQFVDSFAPPESRIEAPRLQVLPISKSGPSIHSQPDSSIVVNETQFVDNKGEQGGPVAKAAEGEGTEMPPMDRGLGKSGSSVVAGGVLGSGGGISSGGGGVSSPSKRYRVKITPKISIKGEYDDNIYLYNNNKKGDFITTVSPGIIMSIDSGRNGLELEYTFGWVRYNDYSENNFVRHSGRLKFWQRLSRRLTFNLSDNYLKSDDLFDEDLAPDLSSQRIRHTRTPYQRNDLNASLDYRFGRQSHLSVGYRHAFLDEDDSDLNDVTEHSPYARLSYWFNNKDGFELGYKYRRFDYSSAPGFTPGNVDLGAHDIDVAYMHRFGRRSTIHARYGLANRNFKGIPVSYHVHDGSVGFEHSFSPSTTLALDIGYFSPTGIDIDPGLEYGVRFERRFKRGRAFVTARSGWDEGFMEVVPRAFTRYWGGDAGVEYEPVQDLEAYANVQYRKNDYALQEEEDDDTVGGRCGVRYRFLRWFYADLGYSHRRRISNDPFNTYRDNRFTFTISASKPHPYNWEFQQNNQGLWQNNSGQDN